jgi:hypothetical protein
MAVTPIVIFTITVLSALALFRAAYRFHRAGKGRAACLIVVVTVIIAVAIAWFWLLGIKALAASFI